MYPNERSLVKRLENKPFALIGINSDEDRDELHKVLAKEQITWRSFWDGGSTNGPIATAWNVGAWPTVYVLDARGVIRYKHVYTEELDRAVDALNWRTKIGQAPRSRTIGDQGCQRRAYSGP
jgi:hypothetical protein